MAVSEASPKPATDGLVETLANPDEGEVAALDAWWRANNYLTVGQIYLMANPLLREPLVAEHIKPRLLGHWGTSPGLSFVYAHVSRLIRHTGQEMLYLTGPGHGGPALVAAGYLEGTYTETYPDVTLDTGGMRRLFRQFSAPGGIPSHVSVTTPGSIHEGGELGYVLAHAFGAVMDNPDLLALAVVGDGEAETGPLEGSWKGISFLNPVRDGAVLPMLHLNGAKIAGPTVLGRKDPAEVRSLLEGHGYEVIEVDGEDLPGDAPPVRRGARPSMGRASARSRKQPAEATGTAARPRWPMIVLRTPEGLDGTRRGRRRAGVRAPGGRTRCRCPGSRRTRATCALLEQWLRSYRPEELFDEGGAPTALVRRANPDGSAADERDAARERWAAHPGPRPAGLPATTPSTSRGRPQCAPSRPASSAR